MKVLSIAIPCFNSAEYMRKCIDSLLVGKDDVEILIVNDGSNKDDTAKIADEYEKKYPTICKAIHKENGGHGDAVMFGLRAATGEFFKVVDSDDYLDKKSFLEVLNKLKEFIRDKENIDMLLCNFVYDKVGVKKKKVMTYKRNLPVNKKFEWEDIRPFHTGQYILMHSVIYRRELLIENGLDLPKHTFYVDNIFVYQPLNAVKNIYYMDVNLYRYYIGREDQSVNEQVMIGRIDQQIRVTKLMLDAFNPYDVVNKKLRKYLISYLEIMMVISSILAILSKDEENLKKKDELWNYLKDHNPRLYRRIRRGALGQAMNLPGKVGRSIAVAGYRIANKLYGFN
nr:glycosyltransferase family 2 protein [uncultured Lachnoanaerobaculum sp.]